MLNKTLHAKIKKKKWACLLHKLFLSTRHAATSSPSPLPQFSPHFDVYFHYTLSLKLIMALWRHLTREDFRFRNTYIFLNTARWYWTWRCGLKQQVKFDHPACSDVTNWSQYPSEPFEQKAMRSHRPDHRQCTALCIVVYIAEGWSQARTRARFLPAHLPPRHIRSIHRATHSVQRLWLDSFLFTRPTEKESSLRKNWSGSPSVFIHKTFSPKSWK